MMPPGSRLILRFRCALLKVFHIIITAGCARFCCITLHIVQQMHLGLTADVGSRVINVNGIGWMHITGVSIISDVVPGRYCRN